LRAPVAFLIFNRPETTEQVFAAIARARPPKLLIVADGPRADRAGEAKKCAAARAIAERVDWECEVLTNYSGTNLGCKNRIASGLDWVFENVEEAIILEDDCVPNQSFFSFCENLLDHHRTNKRVMMISGFNQLGTTSLVGQESYFYSRHFAIWGWATWRRAWQTYDVAIRQWRTTLSVEDLARELPNRLHSVSERLITRSMVRGFAALFDRVQRGELNTWDYQWAFNCLFHDGLSVVPRVNLVRNIGIVGTHSAQLSTIHKLQVAELTTPLVHPTIMQSNVEYDWNVYRAPSGGSAFVTLLRHELLANSWLQWLYGPARKVYHAAGNLMSQR
jgi:hypothetical protein